MAVAEHPLVELPPVEARRRAGLPAAVVLLACGAVALALRVPYFHVGLGIDEGGIAFLAQHWHGTSGTSLYGNLWLDRPPLLVALFKLAVLGGAGGVRALGAVAALALVGTAYALGRTLGGARTAGVAALLTALLSGSFSLAAVYPPAELLAAVPAAGSVACLLASRRRRGLALPAAAGALAVTALLVKQSFFDAGA